VPAGFMLRLVGSVSCNSAHMLRVCQNPLPPTALLLGHQSMLHVGFVCLLLGLLSC
jgi:hypothetical protein